MTEDSKLGKEFRLISELEDYGISTWVRPDLLTILTKLAVSRA